MKMEVSTALKPILRKMVNPWDRTIKRKSGRLGAAARKEAL
jgi:hypothetical protein